MLGLYIGLGVLAVILIAIIGLYNGLVTTRNAVKQSWSGIDVQLKRRADLIPNLLNTVKGYAKHEKEIFENVAKARAEMMQAQASGNIKETAKTNDALSGTLKSLFALSENYPDLKANENFVKMQDELTETEDQIAASRRIYNENATTFNTKIEVFPNNMFAGMFGFKAFDLFEATAEEKKNVEVKFD